MAIYSNDEDTRILHFSLQGILGPEQILALDTRNELAALLTYKHKEGKAYMMASVQLTQSELAVLLPLLEAYPYYCPYELLLASLSGRPTERDIARARERLEAASLDGIWDAEMRPVRNLLSRTRLKIQALHITILAIIETGYLLSKYRNP